MSGTNSRTGRNSSVTTNPEISHQTEFDFTEEPDHDDLIKTKDEPTKTGLGDFFEEAQPEERRTGGPRREHPESSLLEDRTELPSSSDSEQATVVHDVADGQKSLSGEEATGSFTRTVRKCASSEEEE